jgi:hypothetical protein
MPTTIRRRPKRKRAPEKSAEQKQRALALKAERERQAAFVRAARRVLGQDAGREITQQDFSRMLEPRISISLVEKLENGRTPVTPAVAARIAHLLLNGGR